MSYTDEKLKTKMLFYRLIDLKQEFIDLESGNYKKFVIDELGKIIKNNTINGSAYQIVDAYYNYLINAERSEIKYLLEFFKKYNLMKFEIDYPDVVKYIYDEKLTQQDIYNAYNKELKHVNNKNKVIKTKPSIFERLDKFATMEERQAHIKKLASEYNESLILTEQENGYNNFIINRENGLYKILEIALYKYDGKNFKLEYNPTNLNFNYIKEFCDKYGIEIQMIERGELTSKDYLPNIKTIGDIRNLFECFFAELQKIEYFSKSKEELWIEHHNFIANNQEWLNERKVSR